ncbi:Hypothetical predicted protein, partial [Olea europaea subsp. europaea]
MDPKDVIKLAIAVDIKKRLLSRASLSNFPNIDSVKSIGNFIATVNSVKEVALREKYLHGNHNILFLIPWKASAAIAREQTAEAAAIYIPIHGTGES